MFFGPDLSPNWLQRLSADYTSRQRVKKSDAFKDYQVIILYNKGQY